MPLPDAQTRRDIFSIQFRKMPVAEDVDIEDLVSSTERYSGAEVCSPFTAKDFGWKYHQGSYAAWKSLNSMEFHLLKIKALKAWNLIN